MDGARPSKGPAFYLWVDLSALDLKPVSIRRVSQISKEKKASMLEPGESRSVAARSSFSASL